jgi:hypothetical protein
VKLAERLSGIKAANGIDPVLSLLVELQTQKLIVEFLESTVGEFSEDDLLADPVSIGFGEASKIIHTPRELFEILRQWRKLYTETNIAVVKLGLKSRQLDQSREQAALVYGIFQAVLADPGLAVPQSYRTVIRTALAERLRGAETPVGSDPHNRVLEAANRL